MTIVPGILTERAVDPERFATDGVAPRLASRPRDRGELCEIVRAAARDGLSIVPWGGHCGIELRSMPQYDLAIDLSALDRIVEYVPEDLTLTAECGVTIASLGATLAARGQELPLEASHATRATLGGVLATNASGARRMRFGSPRDRILGARFVLGDGTLARTGGKVVKNVAGYGIHRMLCGSRGGLAIVVDASLKLLPAPAARSALIYEFDAAAIADASRWADFACEEPAALTVVSSSIACGARDDANQRAALPGATGQRPYWVVLGLEDEPERIAELRTLAVKRLGEPVLELAGADVVALWQRLADLEDSGTPRLTFSGSRLTPAALASWVARPAGTGCVFHAACGRLHVFETTDHAPQIEQFLAPEGFVRIASLRARGDDAQPGSTATTALRQRIRAALDPAGIFALGEHWVRSSG